MIRPIEWVYNDETDTLQALAQRADGAGSDVVWSTTDTTSPAPWPPPVLAAE